MVDQRRFSFLGIDILYRPKSNTDLPYNRFWLRKNRSFRSLPALKILIKSKNLQLQLLVAEVPCRVGSEQQLFSL